MIVWGWVRPRSSHEWLGLCGPHGVWVGWWYGGRVVWRGRAQDSVKIHGPQTSAIAFLDVDQNLPEVVPVKTGLVIQPCTVFVGRFISTHFETSFLFSTSPFPNNPFL